MKDGNTAPAWLFSFVDLAFLMLIAMTQMSGDAMPELGEIVVPKIRAESAAAGLPAGATERWQLRIYPPDTSAAPAFELARGIPEAGALPERIDSETLRSRLAALRTDGVDRPLLAPHEDSLSRHMLDAIAMMEDFWPNRRRATIEPFLASR